MVYSVSDLHGYPLDTFLDYLENTVRFDDEVDFLYVLGDVIDRGADSVRWLRFLSGCEWAELIRGNHEQMFLDCARILLQEITDDTVDSFADGMENLTDWILNGGGETLSGLKSVAAAERSDLKDFVGDTPLYETVTTDDGRDFLLVHGGLGNFSNTKKLSAYTSDELLWSRPDADAVYFSDIYTVIGHTPTQFYSGEARLYRTKTWCDIDIGCEYGQNGPLILRLDDMREFYLP